MKANRKYCLGNYNEDKLIETLAEKYGTDISKEYLRQMLTTLIKLAREDKDTLDLNLINNSLKEFRYAFKIFGRYRNIRKVVLFGSHRLGEKSAAYKISEEFARKMIEKGFMIITGGGGGIMEAGNKGAGPGKSFAVNIKLPTEQVPNPFVRGEKLITMKYFYTRKLIFIKESDATALFPGGFGTHDEAFEVLTLLQTGKTPPRPLVFVDTKFGTYWKNWLKFIKWDLNRNGFISEHDLDLFRVTNNVDDAVEFVANFYRNYHSIRYVRERTILRLNYSLTERQMSRLNKNYKDILVSGEIEPCSPTPEEIKDKDNLHLYRLSMKFDRYNYGRLHSLIHEINKF